MSNPDKRRWIEHWETVAVTALPPGYVNVYTHAGEPDSEAPCPALLLQEHRESTETWIVEVEVEGELKPRIQARTEDEDPPYTTRVVYAADAGDGSLEPADDVSNYHFTRALWQAATWRRNDRDD